MSVPTLTVKVDWQGTGSFSGGFDNIASRVVDARWRRGRSADYAAETAGGLDLLLDNGDDFLTGSNWIDNPSFEVGTDGWNVVASGGTSAATSIARVADAALGGGSWAGELTTTAAADSGTYYAIPYAFRADQPYTATVYLRVIGGTASWNVSLGSAGTWSDHSTASVSVTQAWAAYSVTWTPNADHADAILAIATDTNEVSGLRIDAVQVNPGEEAYPYVECPTRGMLVSGRPVYVSATYGGQEYAQFFGYVQRFSPDTSAKTVSLTAYDVLGRMADTNVNIPTGPATAYDWRIALLNESEGGNLNLLANPGFDTSLTAWTTSGGLTTSRITTDGAPGTSATTACAQLVFTSATGSFASDCRGAVSKFYASQTYQVSVYLKSSSGQPVKITASLGGTTADSTVTPTSTWVRYSVGVTPTSTVSAASAAGTITITPGSGASFNMTVLVDAAAITKGSNLQPYAAIGSGLQENLCANGSFEGASTTGWSAVNVNTSNTVAIYASGGASAITTGLGVTNWATAYLDYNSSPDFASYATARNGYGVGHRVPFSGTFAAGTTYTMTFSGIAYDNATFKKTLEYRFGTSTDYSSGSCAASVEDYGGRVAVSLTWTPSTTVSSGVYLWAWTVSTCDATTYPSGVSNHALTFGVGITYTAASSFTSTLSATTTTPKVGTYCLSAVTTGPGCGAAYDFGAEGIYFTARLYSVNLWLRSSVSQQIAVTVLGTTTNVSATSAWTAVNLTLTPSTSYGATMTLYIKVAASSTIWIDGVAIVAGALSGPTAKSHWIIPSTGPESTDTYSSTATYSGTASDGLSTLNALTLSRHIVPATTTSPYYEHVDIDREMFVSLAISEVLSEAEDFTSLDSDRTSANNIVVVAYGSTSSHTYSDGVSIQQIGQSPSPQQINGADWFPDTTLPDIIGPAFLARYGRLRTRPRLQVTNSFPNQLERELQELVQVDIPSWRYIGWLGTIQSIETRVSEAGQRWETTYLLEQYPEGIART